MFLYIYIAVTGFPCAVAGSEIQRANHVRSQISKDRRGVIPEHANEQGYGGSKVLCRILLYLKYIYLYKYNMYIYIYMY